MRKSISLYILGLRELESSQRLNSALTAGISLRYKCKGRMQSAPLSKEYGQWLPTFLTFLGIGAA